MEVLAIIPARGGSKGLPGKNIMNLLGHPLVAYSIKAALDSKLITRTIVSTDSEKIRDIAQRYGAEVPYLRPSQIAKDNSTDLEFIQHALDWLSVNNNYKPDFIVQLRPTSPIRFIEDIDYCISKLRHSDFDSLRIVTLAQNTPYKMWFINNDQLEPILVLEEVKEPYNSPRQILPKVYWQIGTLDVIKTSTIIEKNSVSGDKIMPHVVDAKYAVDIDTIDSFHQAERLIQTTDCVKF